MNNNGGKYSRAKEKLGESRRKRKDEIAEDRCFFCKNGGLLMFCDQEECLKAYHPSCVNKDDSFVNSGKHWTCDVHSCFLCHKSSDLNCLACPKSLCKRCIGSTKFVQIKGKKGLCSSCLNLALRVEKDKDADFNMPFERQFAGAWITISQKEGLTLKDLNFADDRMKENKFYISGFDLDMDDEHVKICKGKEPMVKRKKLSLLNKIPRVVAAEGRPELLCVKNESEMEGNGIYLGDQGILVRDASRRLKIGSSNHDGIGEGSYQNAAAKVTEGDAGVMGQNASSQLINTALADNDGIREGINNTVCAKVTAGDCGIVGQYAFYQSSKIGSANNAGVVNGKYRSSSANAIGGVHGIVGQDASSRRPKIGSANNARIGSVKYRSPPAYAIEGDRGIVRQDALSRIFMFGSVNNDGIGNGKSYSTANAIEGDRNIVDQDASYRIAKFSANNDGVGNGKNYSATANAIEGDQGIMVRDASRSAEIGLSNYNGTAAGNNYNAGEKVSKGDEGIMGRNASQPINFNSVDNDGIRNGNNHIAAAKVTKGDRGVVGQDASSLYSIFGSANDARIGHGKNHTAKVIEGAQGILVENASQSLKIGLSINDGMGEGNDRDHDAAAIVTNGNKVAEDNGPTFDEQAEAILKSRPEWDNSAAVPDQSNLAMKDQDFKWNVIVSEDGKVKGPYQLHSLKCLQDIYTVSSFLKVFKEGESEKTAIPLGDALKLHSI